MAEEYDGCECVWSHELAMRRLLTLIRQGQSFCTDTECIDLTQRPSNNEPENFTMLMIFFIFAGILYFLRPNSILRSVNDSKRHDDQPPPSNGDGGEDSVFNGGGGRGRGGEGAPPPQPPPAIN